MLQGNRVLIAYPDRESGQEVASAFLMMGAEVVGPVPTGALAMAELDRMPPDVVLVEPGGPDADLIPLLERVLRDGIPTVVCADPGLLPEFRGRHPTLSVLSAPCRPLRVVGEVAVLLEA